MNNMREYMDIVEGKKISKASAKYRVHDFAKSKGLNTKDAVARWKRNGEPTDVSQIKTMLHKMAKDDPNAKSVDLKTAHRHDGKTFGTDNKVSDMAKQMLMIAIDSNYEEDALEAMTDIGLGNSMNDWRKRVFSRESVEVDSKDARKIIDAVTKKYGEGDAKTEDEAMEALDDVEEDVIIETAFEWVFKQYGRDEKLNESLQSDLILKQRHFALLDSLLEHYNMSWGKFGYKLTESNGDIVVQNRNVINESVISEYLDEPLALNLPKIIALIPNIDKEVGAIHRTLYSMMGDRSTETKTLRNISDQIMALSKKGVDISQIFNK